MIDDIFGFIPNNIELYKLALIHKSASIVIDGQTINNERLEFLGDAVIESVTSDYLFIEYPEYDEGRLTQLRSKIVPRQSLNGIAKTLGLDKCVICNHSVSSSQKHIFGDAFEAMMGAIYLDQGYDFVNRLLINKIFVDYIKVDNLTEEETDFKSRLIEWCQKNHHTIHFATTHDKTYSATHPFFYSKVLIDNIEVGHGAGESKKEAEQRAAFSVSQGINDTDCTKLLDKLDNFDAQNNKRIAEKPAEKAPAQEPKPKTARKPEEPKATKKATKEESNGDEQKPRPARKPRKQAVAQESNSDVAEPSKEANAADNNIVTENKEAKEVKEQKNIAQTSTATDKPARRRPVRRPRKAAENQATNSESTEKRETNNDKE